MTIKIGKANLALQVHSKRGSESSLIRYVRKPRYHPRLKHQNTAEYAHSVLYVVQAGKVSLGLFV